MAIALISEADRKTLASVLKEDCPPWLLDLVPNPTADQIQAWFGLKTLYQDLLKMFENYFQLLPLPLLEHRPPDERKLLRLQFRRYLSFYNLISFGWDSIEEAAAKEGVDLGKRYNARSPGEAFAFVIYLDSRVFLEPSLQPYYRYSPSETRYLAKTDKEITKTLNLGKQPDKQIFNKYQQTLHRNLDLVEQYLRFRGRIVSICQSKKKGSKGLQAALRAYNVASSELDAQVQSMSHKRHKRKGGEWRNGRFSPMDSFGGIPLNKTSK